MEICRCEEYYNLIKDEHFYVVGTYYHAKECTKLSTESNIENDGPNMEPQKEPPEKKSEKKEEDHVVSSGEEAIESKWIPVSGIVSQKLINEQKSSVVAPYG